MIAPETPRFACATCDFDLCAACSDGKGGDRKGGARSNEGEDARQADKEREEEEEEEEVEEIQEAEKVAQKPKQPRKLVHPRPEGETPKGMRWDKNNGGWVPELRGGGGRRSM